jgi:transcriptional regulator with XRE-family HTH domain
MNTSTGSTSVGETVRRIMADKGITQVELSDATFIPRATLIRRLHGQSSFTVTELVAVAAALDVSASVLIEDAA